MNEFPNYSKRAKYLILETKQRYKLYIRLFQGLVVAVVCFLIVFLNQKRETNLGAFVPKQEAKVVYSLQPNLLRDGKFQSTLNFSGSGVDLVVFPLATPQHLKQIDDHEDGLQLYVSKSSFRPSPKQQSQLQLFSTEQGQYPVSDHHDPRFDIESLNSPPPDFEGLITLFAAFSRWADQKEFPYWLAHANLLGWYWESKSLSWDNSINVHLPANLLYDIVELNGTLWSNRFMVIVNDHFTQRNYEKGYAVDAIFVDTITGLNIDIYGVSSLSHSLISNPILHTKTPYSYEFDDIFPLVRTTLDGIPTWRPFNTSKILENEYGYSGTHSNIYMNSRYDPIIKDWVKLSTCKELYQWYIEPVIKESSNLPKFPRYQWVQHLKDPSKGAKLRRCAVVEYSSPNESRRITAIWSKRDIGFKGISGEDLDGARRRV